MLGPDGFWSLWTLYPYLVIFPGALLIAMFATNIRLFTSAASKLAGPRVNTPLFGDLQLSTLMCAFSLVFAATSFAAISKNEVRAVESHSSKHAHFSETNFHLKMHFYEFRNFLMFTLGVLIWAGVGRFKELVDSGQLTRPTGGFGGRTLVHRGLFAVLAVVFLLVADVPLCRVHYNSAVASYISPTKVELLDSRLAKDKYCGEVMLKDATGECKDFCEEARALSQLRHEKTMEIRDWHAPGRLAAEVFDVLRLEEQGPEKINELFERRTCKRVLQSVDKTNSMVNYLCVTFSFLAMLGFLSAVLGVFGEPPRQGHEHNE